MARLRIRKRSPRHEFAPAVESGRGRTFFAGLRTERGALSDTLPGLDTGVSATQEQAVGNFERIRRAKALQGIQKKLAAMFDANRAAAAAPAADEQIAPPVDGQPQGQRRFPGGIPDVLRFLKDRLSGAGGEAAVAPEARAPIEAPARADKGDIGELQRAIVKGDLTNVGQIAQFLGIDVTSIISGDTDSIAATFDKLTSLGVEGARAQNIAEELSKLLLARTVPGETAKNIAGGSSSLLASEEVSTKRLRLSRKKMIQDRLLAGGTIPPQFFINNPSEINAIVDREIDLIPPPRQPSGDAEIERFKEIRDKRAALRATDDPRRKVKLFNELRILAASQFEQGNLTFGETALKPFEVAGRVALSPFAAAGRAAFGSSEARELSPEDLENFKRFRSDILGSEGRRPTEKGATKKAQDRRPDIIFDAAKKGAGQFAEVASKGSAEVKKAVRTRASAVLRLQKALQASLKVPLEAAKRMAKQIVEGSRSETEAAPRAKKTKTRQGESGEEFIRRQREFFGE